MQINILSPDDFRWQLAVDELFHDFYHLPAYSKLESVRLKTTPQCAAIRDGKKSFLIPYLLRSCADIEDKWNEDIYDIVSPYGYPGFVVNEAGQDPDFIGTCFNQLTKIWYEQNICSAFIRLHPIINNYFPFSNSFNHNFAFTHGNIVVCNLLSTDQDIWKQTRRSHRNNVSKLKVTGFNCSITPVNGLRSLKDFLQIYEATMIRVGAKDSYFFSPKYFEKLASILDEYLYICEVEVGGQTVASSLVTESCGIVQYHLGGTRDDFVHQSPSILMITGSKEDSLYHFKSGFSKLTKPFTTIKMVVNENMYSKLIESSCQRSNRPILDVDISNQSFFPAYRA
jgi:hypothetical protein